MLKKTWIAISVVTLTILLLAGVTYSLSISSPIMNGKATVKMLSVNATFVFDIDNTKKGIPGELVPISKKNVLEKPLSSEDVVFKVVYEIKNPQTVSFIDHIELKDSKLATFVKHPDSTATKLIYYGVFSDKTAKSVDLGIVSGEFSIGNGIDQNYELIADFRGCQRTKEAIKETLGIDPVGDFAFLLK